MAFFVEVATVDQFEDLFLDGELRALALFGLRLAEMWEQECCVA